MADCFLKLDQVSGESHDQEFDGYIQVDSWQWGVAQNASLAAAISDARGAPTVHSLSFVHAIDSASTGLLSRCVKNTVISKGDLAMRRAGGKAQKYLTIKLEKVRVLSVDIIHDAQHETPSERVVLAFDRFDLEYVPQSALGANKSGPSTFSWQRIAS